MLPEQREWYGQMQGKPFVLLGINSDEDRSVLKSRMEKHKVTWPNIVAGAPDVNPISKQWNVRSWPTVYVLDHEGKIYKRALESHKDVAAAVHELLAKMK
ncbi:MAG: TlpA disulfide reductase family protein [Planctomycetota bacterium]